MSKAKRENWSGALGFILAAAGSAIGLGNIWKFPYITGLNGGGAFVLIYLLCILLVGLPVMLCELTIGRNTRKDPYGAFRELQREHSLLARIFGWLLVLGAVGLAIGGSWGFAAVALIFAVLLLTKGFATLGLLGVFGGLAILSYYAVVGGWAVAYMLKAFRRQLDYHDLGAAQAAFSQFVENPGLMVGFQLVFMVLCALVIWSGVRKGIERWSKILMPLLFLLLLAVILRSLTLPGARAGVAFFLYPDFSKLSTAGVLEALGHSFYTLSLGMGITVTYGSYLKREQNMISASLWVIVLDTLAATMAGLAIFPAVFAMGFDPASGPSLLFEVLPATFNSFPGGFGWFWCGLFFLMLSIAALTSGVALLQIGTAYFMDQFKIRRHWAILISFAGVAALGVLSSVSIGNWENLEALKRAIGMTFGAGTLAGSFFDTLDYLASNWMLPLSGMFIAIFVAWEWGMRPADAELRQGAERWTDRWLPWGRRRIESSPDAAPGAEAGVEPGIELPAVSGIGFLTIWNFLVRFVSPVIILLVFLYSIGVIKPR